jgi:hypothetical protein
LVFLGIIAIAFRYARRKRRAQEQAALDSEPKPFVVGSAAVDEGRTRPDHPMLNPHSTSESRLVTGTELTQDLIPRSPDLPIAPANIFSDSEASPFSPRHSVLPGRKRRAARPPPMPSSSAAPAVSAIRAWPTGRELVASVANAQGISAAKLTDEQIDSVTRLLNTGVPATDVARVIERMKTVREQELTSAQMSSGADAETAPPGYGAINH